LREFLEVEDVDTFMRIAQTANLLVRVDPYVLIYIYGLTFYIDLGKLDKREVNRIFQGLKDRLVVVKRVEAIPSLHDFLEKRLREKEEDEPEG
jgi:hypothetical protein